MMPMIFLILRRALYVVRQASSVTLADSELDILLVSLYHLFNAVLDRIHILQGKQSHTDNQDTPSLTYLTSGIQTAELG